MTINQTPADQTETASKLATTLAKNWADKGFFRGGVFAANADAFLNLLLALIEANAEQVFAQLAPFRALPEEAVPVLEPLTFLVNEALGRRDNIYLPSEKRLYLAAMTVAGEMHQYSQVTGEKHIQLALSLDGEQASSAEHRACDDLHQSKHDAKSQSKTTAEALELFAPAFCQALITACARDGLADIVSLEPLETKRITEALDWIGERQSLSVEMEEAKRTKNRITYGIWLMLNKTRLNKYRLTDK